MTQAEEILAEAPSDAGFSRAQRMVEAFAFTTTALAAMAGAIERMGSPAQAAAIRAFLPTLAAIEAEEV